MVGEKGGKSCGNSAWKKAKMTDTQYYGRKKTQNIIVTENVSHKSIQYTSYYCSS